MFIVTAKVSRRRTALIAVCLAALAAVLIIVLCGSRPANGVGPAAETDEARIEYLRSLGWQVQAEPIEVQTLSLPKPLAEPYLSYNTLQLSQGFDLNAFCGKTLERYTYAITNYPDRPKGCQADLYLYKGHVVAGDIVCTGANGFLTALAYPKK